MPNDLEGQGQGCSYWIEVIIPLRYTISVNLSTLNWFVQKLLCGQGYARGSDLISKSAKWTWRSRSFIPNRVLAPPWCISCVNLVNVHWFVQELLSKQGSTDGQTDRQMQLTTIPLQPLGSRGKNQWGMTKCWSVAIVRLALRQDILKPADQRASISRHVTISLHHQQKWACI